MLTERAYCREKERQKVREWNITEREKVRERESEKKRVRKRERYREREIKR